MREALEQGDKVTRGQGEQTQTFSVSPCPPVPLSARPRVLVLGLGNPLLGDDGIGWIIAEQVRQRLRDETVEVDCHAGGGLSLMERLVGYDRVILVDAVNSGTRPIGSLHCCPLDDLTYLAHCMSAHDCSLLTALATGRRLGAHLPDQVFVVGVETRSVFDFSEELSPPAAAAVPPAVEMVLSYLD